MTTLTGRIIAGDSKTDGGAASAAAPAAHRHRIVALPIVIVTALVVLASCGLRVELARDTLWQCDEIPLLVRFTGLCGLATNEAEAAAFQPTRWSLYNGALRSVHIPKYPSALHTTTGFWTNLTMHLFGATPFAGRVAPLFFSMAAILLSAWAAWLATRSVVGTCLAAWFIALSPHHVFYGAQARAYAEALALVPLLLVLLEYYRRRPDRWPRAVAVAVCAIWLSLTVYTAWIFCVLPVLVVSACVLPKYVEIRSLRPAARTGLVVIAVALLGIMTVFTVDRMHLLTYTAENFGTDLSNLQDVWHWLTRLVADLAPAPAGMLVLVLIGAAALRRSHVGWWTWPIAAAVIAPLAWTIARGSPGFSRNLGYLIGPMAIVFAIGGCKFIHWVTARTHIALVTATVAAAFVGVSATAYARLDQQTRAMMLPDWGALTRSLDREPETIGPRWLAPCLANHWQINWYRQPVGVDTFLGIPRGGRIEVVMGASLDRFGRPRIFRQNPTGVGIFEEDLPDYLRAVSPIENHSGIEVRRWVGTRVESQPILSIDPNAPVFVLANFARPVLAADWDRFLQQARATETGVVTFKTVHHESGEIRSMVLPSEALRPVVDTMFRVLDLPPDNLRIFTLSSLGRQ
ncbi:MAG: hypothetical protein IH987_02505 [Planctomycetes bacterium]|nr:hypothetical protein [Planctomycetota bacterium]